ncbi:MAG: hypothetical protein ACTHKG_03710 [Nocardioides sp.]
MRISRAGADDVAELARLLWLNHHDEEPALQSAATFTAELAQWWAAHVDSHHAFVARLAPPQIVVHSGRTAVPLYERLGLAGSRELLKREPG